MTLVAYDLSVGRHVEMPLRHLSPTSLMRAATCPEQFRRQNILGERQAPSEAALVGTAIHDALGMSCVNYIAHQQHLEPVDVATYVEDIGFDSAVEREEQMTEMVAEFKDRDAAKRRASKSSAAWMRDVAPRLRPSRPIRPPCLPVMPRPSRPGRRASRRASTRPKTCCRSSKRMDLVASSTSSIFFFPHLYFADQCSSPWLPMA
jgi:hypothetical protein